MTRLSWTQTAGLSVLLFLLLLSAGCDSSIKPEQSPPPLSAQEEEQLELALDAQLGLLADQLSETEREWALDVMKELWPIQQARLKAGRYEKSEREQWLIRRLNQFYERYTLKYLGDGGTWGYSNPTERTLAEYQVIDGVLHPDARSRAAAGADEYTALWEQMTELLPEGALDDFSRFVVFTDGEAETLAYVTMADSRGARWEIAVDPADAQDGVEFTETILHEYCHYLTLNEGQATYSDRQTVDTYNEQWMQTRQDSYLNAFYQRFWVNILEDRLANMESFNFFLRHEDDFVSGYASTDPSEDIAESFTYFVLYDRQPGSAVWEQKLNFFYEYPELVEFRTAVRQQVEAQ